MNRDPRHIERHLLQRAEGRPTSQKLAFDPTTGELSLVPRGSNGASPQNPDAVVVDQIAEEGFFTVEAPTVVVHDAQLDELALGKHERAVAFASDGGDVVHVHVGALAGRPTGAPVRARVVVVEGAEFDRIARACVDARPNGGRRETSLSVSVVVELGGARLVACVSDGNEVRACRVVRIPRRSDLFSRARGLLDTDALADRHVVIVGLGSGGSSIALELARAGVGRFSLFDPEQLELANVIRHACGVGDVGRFKVNAVADLLADRNPHVEVDAYPVDVNVEPASLEEAVADADLVIGATDENRSRARVNELAVRTSTVALFGRALSRAAGGDVLRVRPGQGPCLACVFEAGLMSQPEEVSSARQAENVPAYTSAADRQASIQPGLATDIAPIANLLAKLALLELSRGTSAMNESLDADLAADLYLWANRRELTYASWEPMAYGSRTPSVLRWYGARVARSRDCAVCAPPSRSDGLALRDGPRQWG